MNEDVSLVWIVEGYFQALWIPVPGSGWYFKEWEAEAAMKKLAEREPGKYRVMAYERRTQQ